MTNLEQVEKLCAMANISYEEAKAALDAANGDLLDAIILLERQGKIHAPSGGGYYSSEKVADAKVESYKDDYWEKHNCKSDKASFSSLLGKAWEFCMKLFRKGNANSFEVLKRNEVKASIPVTALVLLLIFAFWITLPLLIIGFFFGLRYRFVGTDFKSNTINDAMDSAADAAEELKKSIKI